MTSEEIRLRRLACQHLLIPADPQTVARDLCGLQAQYWNHALHALRIRSGVPDTSGLVRSWTNRGTMHLFSIDDLPLFLHMGRSHRLRPVDTLEDDTHLTAERKAVFAHIIVDAIAQGIDDREVLKAVCKAAGMTQDECQSLFDPWGGIIRALCESGRICCRAQARKAYQLCPPFEPMSQADAQRELLHRYFSHYGPATIKDAACYFGTTQAQIKAVLSQLPVTETSVDGMSYFHIEPVISSAELPDCLFLAGFDPLMLGYEKTESLFLPCNHVRDIFTRTGIVRPAVLVQGTVVGWWSLKNRCLTVRLFAPDKKGIVTDAAERLFPALKQIAFD